MFTCPWCEKEVPHLVEFKLPDDDFIEICSACFLEEEASKEAKFSVPRLKTEDRTYARV